MRQNNCEHCGKPGHQRCQHENCSGTRAFEALGRALEGGACSGADVVELAYLGGGARAPGRGTPQNRRLSAGLTATLPPLQGHQEAPWLLLGEESKPEPTVPWSQGCLGALPLLRRHDFRPAGAPAPLARLDDALACHDEQGGGGEAEPAEEGGGRGGACARR